MIDEFISQSKCYLNFIRVTSTKYRERYIKYLLFPFDTEGAKKMRSDLAVNDFLERMK